MKTWKSLTGLAQPPKSDDPAFKAWKSTLLNLATVAEVEASLDKFKSKDISVFKGLMTKCINKRGLWNLITQFMIDRKVDAASVALQLNSRQPPRTFARWIHPHINNLGLLLFGSEAKQSDLSDVVKDRVYAVAGELLRISFEKQSKDLQYSTETFQHALQSLKSCVDGKSKSIDCAL